jgi:rhodanese-related sulfurtransferase/outer membrane protein assembly factor BamB
MERITAGDPPLILDVRSKHEYDAGHVPGAVHVPFWQAGRYSQRLAAKRESPLVLYCGHGPRAHIAGAALRRRGFTNILYLAGHMKKWRAMKLPLAIVCLLLGAGALLAQQPEVRMVGVDGEGAKYWPVWRGPSGQGLATGTYPDTWSATENVVWKKPVPGRGNSSPIVWGDRIFLTSAYEGGRRLSLIAFRRTDGAQLWEAFAPDGRTGRAHYKNGHASATPSTDGTLVYASFGSRGLAAFDYNGKLVWHKDLGDVDNYHGSAGSPLLYRNRIILYQDFDGGSFVAAFDAKTGKELGGRHACVRRVRSLSPLKSATRSSSAASHRSLRTIRIQDASCGCVTATRTKSSRRQWSATDWCLPPQGAWVRLSPFGLAAAAT